MSRVAQIDIEFRAVLDKARSEFRSFKSEVENSPMRVPFSGEGTGVPSSTRTFGGFVVPGSSAVNPIGSFTSLTSSVAQLTQQLNQLSSSLSRVNVQQPATTASVPSSSNDSFTSRAYSGIYNRFARAGGLFLAARGVAAIERQVVRGRDLEESLEYDGPDAAARVAAEQTREDRAGLAGSAIRRAFVRNLSGTAVGRGFSGAATFLGLVPEGSTYQTDEERLQQDRENVARLAAKRETERFNVESRRNDLSYRSVTLDDIERRRAQAAFRFGETETEAARAKSAISTSGVAPDAAQEVIHAANENVRKAKALLDAESRALDDERRHVLRRLGLQSEVAADRAGNRPLQAARHEQQLRAEDELFQFRYSPDLPQRQQVTADVATALSREQAREVATGIAALSGGNEAISYALARLPLQSRLSDIRTTANVDLLRIGNDPERADERRLRGLREQLQEHLAAQEDEDERQQIRLRQSTRRRQIGLLLSHNVVGAEAEGVVGGAEGRATALFNAGFRAESQDELRNAIGDLALTRQSFREGFHATAIGQNDFNIESPRQTQNIAEAFGSLADAEKRLQSDLAKGGGTGDEASNPVTKKLDDIALRIENAVRSLIPH